MAKQKKASPQHNHRWGVVLFLLCISVLLNILLCVNVWNRSIVIAVPDGDTLQLRDGRRVRLRSIDAPEKGRCIAPEAQKLLEKATLHRHIRLKEQLTDSYGRILAIVIVEDLRSWVGYWQRTTDPLINRVMVRRGLARHFSSGSNYDNLLSKQSNIAKTSQLGIYSDTCRSLKPTDNCTIKGNLRSGKKTYYLPICNAYDQVIVDEAYGDQWFCTEEEAQAQEFEKSTKCQL